MCIGSARRELGDTKAESGVKISDSGVGFRSKDL